MKAQRLNAPSLMKPLGSYCHVVRKGNLVTVAGTVAVDGNGQLVGKGDIGAQTRTVLENIRSALEVAGAKTSDVLKMNVYLTDFANYKRMNEVFDQFFHDCPPARATVRADLYSSDWLVEIDALAVVDE